MRAARLRAHGPADAEAPVGSPSEAVTGCSVAVARSVGQAGAGAGPLGAGSAVRAGAGSVAGAQESAVAVSPRWGAQERSSVPTGCPVPPASAWAQGRRQGTSAAGSDTRPAGPGVVARSDPVGGPLGALVLVLVLGSDDGDGAADAADAVGPIGISRLVGRSAGDRAWGSTAPGRGSVTAEVRHGAKLPLTPPPWEVRHARLGRGRAPRGRLSHSAVSAAGPWTWDNGGPDQHLRSRGWAESSTSRHPLVMWSA